MWWAGWVAGAMVGWLQAGGCDDVFAARYRVQAQVPHDGLPADVRCPVLAPNPCLTAMQSNCCQRSSGGDPPPSCPQQALPAALLKALLRQTRRQRQERRRRGRTLPRWIRQSTMGRMPRRQAAAAASGRQVCPFGSAAGGALPCEGRWIGLGGAPVGLHTWACRVCHPCDGLLRSLAAVPACLTPQSYPSPPNSTATGKVVGVIKRNWRTRGYCGSLQVREERQPNCSAEPAHSEQLHLQLPVLTPTPPPPPPPPSPYASPSRPRAAAPTTPTACCSARWSAASLTSASRRGR